nr:MAG TPA: putative tail component [Caudoviricetes sp.]
MAQITIKGTKELQNLLKNVGTAPIERTIKKVTVEVQGQAKALAPFNTGTLRNSIKMNYDSNKKEGRVYTNLEYATYVEFGTGTKGNGTYPNKNISISYRNTPWIYTPDGGKTFYYTKGQVAQPYMYPALQFGKSKAQEILKQEIAKEIKGGN